MNNPSSQSAVTEEKQLPKPPRYLNWLMPVLALLALLLAVLLTTGFRILWYSKATVAKASAEYEWQTALDREAALRQDLALLQQQWLGQQAQCPVIAVRPPEPKPAPIAPPPALAQKPAATPDPPALIKPDTPLEIPKDAENMGFLDGCWRSVTSLIERKTKKPIQHEYCFDASGSGQVTVHSSGYLCKGKISATMKKQNSIVIKTQDRFVACDNKTRFSGWQVNCQSQSDGKAVCQGFNNDDKTRFDVILLRK